MFEVSPRWTGPSYTRSASQSLLVPQLLVASLLTQTKQNAHNPSLFACTSSRFRRDVILLVACWSHYAGPSPGGVPLLALGFPVVLMRIQFPIVSFFPSKHRQQSASPKRRSCDDNLVSDCGEKSRPAKGTVYTISDASPSV